MGGSPLADNSLIHSTRKNVATELYRAKQTEPPYYGRLLVFFREFSPLFRFAFNSLFIILFSVLICFYF